MYKRNVMRKPALSINAHISIGVIAQLTSVHVHVHCIREDVLNTNCKRQPDRQRNTDTHVRTIGILF